MAATAYPTAEASAVATRGVIREVRSEPIIPLISPPEYIAYTTVAGIDSDFSEPAYKHIIFRPLPLKELGSAKARIISENGEIVSAWEYTDNECKFSFTVPEGSYATLYLDGKEYTLQSGINNMILPTA